MVTRWRCSTTTPTAAPQATCAAPPCLNRSSTSASNFGSLRCLTCVRHRELRHQRTASSSCTTLCSTAPLVRVLIVALHPPCTRTLGAHLSFWCALSCRSTPRQLHNQAHTGCAGGRGRGGGLQGGLHTRRSGDLAAHWLRGASLHGGGHSHGLPPQLPTTRRSGLRHSRVHHTDGDHSSPEPGHPAHFQGRRRRILLPRGGLPRQQSPQQPPGSQVLLRLPLAHSQQLVRHGTLVCLPGTTQPSAATLSGLGSGPPRLRRQYQHRPIDGWCRCWHAVSDTIGDLVRRPAGS